MGTAQDYVTKDFCQGQHKVSKYLLSSIMGLFTLCLVMVGIAINSATQASNECQDLMIRAEKHISAGDTRDQNIAESLKEIKTQLKDHQRLLENFILKSNKGVFHDDAKNNDIDSNRNNVGSYNIHIRNGLCYSMA